MLKFAVILSLHSVVCQRSFSAMNATKINLRNPMCIINMNNVISVCVNLSNTQLYKLEIAFQV